MLDAFSGMNPVETASFMALLSRIRALGITVLLVEPETATQKQIVDQLTKRGHRVVPVTSAEEAADLAHRMKFDLSALRNLVAYKARVAARPTVQEALTKEGLMKAA